MKYVFKGHANIVKISVSIKLQPNLSLFWQKCFFHFWTLQATLNFSIKGGNFHCGKAKVLSFLIENLKLLYGTWAKPPPYSFEISRVGKLILVEWTLKYVASKSISCFLLINTQIFLLMQKVWIKSLSFMQAVFWNFLFCREMHQLVLLICWQELMQAVFNIGIPILGTLIWVSPNPKFSKTESTVKQISSFLIKSAM